jgi:hypothetical protein
MFLAFQVFSRITPGDIRGIDDVVYNFKLYSATSMCQRGLKPFRAKSFYDSIYGNHCECLAFMEKTGNTEALRRYVGLTGTGFLHMAGAYLVQNKNRPDKEEVRGFYEYAVRYKPYNRCAFYMKPIIPLFYRCEPAGKLYAALLRTALWTRTTLRRLLRKHADKARRGS